MQSRKIGINGFGRIGKLAFTIGLQSGLNISHINSPSITADLIIHALKYDSTFGKLLEIQKSGENLIFNNKTIRITNYKNPEDIEWSVDLLIECSGVFKTYESLLKHNVPLVVLSAPSDDIPMFVIGCNDDFIKRENKIISNASCTTNCLLPFVKFLETSYGIKQGMMSTIHAVTNSQKAVDANGLKRINRSLLNNIIPSTTGATKAAGKIYPKINKKLTGMAFRVPVNDVSVIDLTVELNCDITLEQIKTDLQAFKSEIILICEDLVVSSDFIKSPYSTIFDYNASLQLNERLFKFVLWYDNEYGYTNRLIELVIKLLILHEE